MYIAVLVTAGTMAVSALAGYGFARIRFRGQNVLFLIVLVGLLVPIEVTIVPMFRAVSALGLIDTHWPLIIIPIFGPPSVLATFIMRQFFVGIPRRARGGGTHRRSRPMGDLPTCCAAAGRTGSRLGRDHHVPEVLEHVPRAGGVPLQPGELHAASRPHAVRRRLWRAHVEHPAGGETLTAVPVLIVFVLAQRHFIQGLAQSGLKG